MKTQSKRRMTMMFAATAASALVLAGCNGNGGDDVDETPAENGDVVEDENGDDNGDEDAAPEADGPVILGILPAWTDGLSMAHLWDQMLDDQGVEVQIEEITEAGPLYTAVASGDYHVYPSAWPEVTHAEYMDTYGDDLEDLGAYYEGAVLTLAAAGIVGGLGQGGACRHDQRQTGGGQCQTQRDSLAHVNLRFHGVMLPA